MLHGSLILLMTIMTQPAQGKDLGTYGQTFKIAEESLLSVIQRKLQAIVDSGKLEGYQQDLQNKVKQSLTRPTPLDHITHTKEPRTFTYDPSIVVQQDLKDHKGQVFYQKGQRVNPLHTRKLTKPLLFIDGDEISHLNWLKQKLSEHPHAKIILVRGSPFELMEKNDWTVYFDQAGKLTAKLGIKQVPAIVTQAGDQLQIDEEIPDEA